MTIFKVSGFRYNGLKSLIFVAIRIKEANKRRRSYMTQETNPDHQPKTAVDPPVQKTDHRVFLNDQGQGTFICPACERAVIRDLSTFIGRTSAIRLKCKCGCGNVYWVLVEQRRHFRMPVNLVGRFIHEGGQGSATKGIIRIKNISQSGIQFSVNIEPEFDVGDKLIIEFALDDGERSQIREEGIVRRIQSNIIGVQFESTDHYGKLGRYLFR